MSGVNCEGGFVTNVLTGGCLCGAVRFEIRDRPRYADWCYCSHCRKVSGAAGDPSMAVRSDRYRITQGREHIRVYELPGFANRCFCERCGSPAPLPGPPGTLMGVPMGLLDTDPGVHPLLHKFVNSKAAWVEILDDLPQFPERPSAEDFARLGITR